MTGEEYKVILEKHIDHAMMLREKLAYALALDLFLMVEADKPAQVPEEDGQSDDEPKTARKIEAGALDAEVNDKAVQIKSEPKKQKRKYSFKAKVCKICGEEFVPRYGAQSMCINCAGKIADRKVKPEKKKPDNSEAREIAKKLTGGVNGNYD